MQSAVECKPAVAARDRTKKEFGNAGSKNELTPFQKEAASVGETFSIFDFLGAENILSKWKYFDPIAFVQRLCISVNQILVCSVERVMEIKLGMLGRWGGNQHHPVLLSHSLWAGASAVYNPSWQAFGSFGSLHLQKQRFQRSPGGSYPALSRKGFPLPASTSLAAI